MVAYVNQINVATKSSYNCEANYKEYAANTTQNCALSEVLDR